MNNNQLVIQLDNPLQINNGKGDLRDVEVLVIYLPTVQYYNLYAGVKEVVMSAMFELEDKISNSSNNNDTGSDELTDSFPLDLFLSSGTVMKLAKEVNKYLLKCAKWDDDLAVNDRHINKLQISDYNKILERVSYFLYLN